MKPQFIDHIVLIVKDLNETEKFYTSFLGKPEYLDKEQATYQVVYKIGDTKIFFVLPWGEFAKTHKDKGGLNHIAFGVSSSDELRKFEKVLKDTLINNSGIMIDRYGSNEFIWFDDPDGYRLEFYCRPE